MRGLIKKMLEEHEKTKIKAPRSTSKRNEKTRSKSNTKEKDSRDIKNCTNNCLDSKTGAKKDPHAMEMRRSSAKDTASYQLSITQYHH